MTDDQVKSLKGTFQLDSPSRIYVWQGLSKSHHVHQPLPVILQRVGPVDPDTETPTQFPCPTDLQRPDEDPAPSKKSSNKGTCTTSVPRVHNFSQRQTRSHRRHSDLHDSTDATMEPHTPSPPLPQGSPTNIPAANKKVPAKKARQSIGAKQRGKARSGVIGGQGVTWKITEIYGVEITFYALRGRDPLLAVPEYVEADMDDAVFSYNFTDEPNHVTWVATAGEWVEATEGAFSTMLKDDEKQLMRLRLYETTTKVGRIANWVKSKTVKRNEFD